MPNDDISKLTDEELEARIALLRETRIPAAPGEGKKRKARRLDASSNESKPKGRTSIFDTISSTRSTISDE